METLVFNHSTGNAAAILQNGGLVSVPTETVYGLAGNGLDEKAVEKIYAVKGRPAVKPLSLLVSSTEEIGRYACEIPDAAETLAKKYWPGPLTMVFRARPEIPEIVRAGGSTIGLRCPDHPLTLQLLREAGIPFAAPSANLSGGKSPKTAEDVLAVFQGQIDAVVDGGPCTIGTESTILDLSAVPYHVLRIGALSAEEIEDTLVHAMTIIGITGSTGSGKSSALEALRDRGALVIDCDAVYHELLTTSEEMMRQLLSRFPDAFSSGAFDRKALGRIVFADAKALQDLNHLSHRFVKQEVWRRLRQHAMSGGKTAAIDAIELISSGLDAFCDVTVAVLAPEEVRINRIMKRDGISEEYARARVKAQKTDDYFRKNCTFTVENNGTEEEFLHNFIQTIWKE